MVNGNGVGPISEQQIGTAGMDAILEEPWRGSCQFSGMLEMRAQYIKMIPWLDIMEAMGQNDEQKAISEWDDFDYEREPVF